MKNNSWNCEAINYASKAAGPLAGWLEKQLEWEEVLGSEEPLRKELKKLKEEERRILKEKNMFEKDL